MASNHTHDLIHQVEQMVESDYKEELIMNCQKEKEYKRRKLYQVIWTESIGRAIF